MNMCISKIFLRQIKVDEKINNSVRCTDYSLLLRVSFGSTFISGALVSERFKNKEQFAKSVEIIAKVHVDC